MAGNRLIEFLSAPFVFDPNSDTKHALLEARAEAFFGMYRNQPKAWPFPPPKAPRVANQMKLLEHIVRAVFPPGSDIDLFWDPKGNHTFKVRKWGVHGGGQLPPCGHKLPLVTPETMAKSYLGTESIYGSVPETKQLPSDADVTLMQEGSLPPGVQPYAIGTVHSFNTAPDGVPTVYFKGDDGLLYIVKLTPAALPMLARAMGEQIRLCLVLKKKP